MEPMIYTNAAKADVGALLDYDLDLAYGSDENNFELVVDKDIENGSFVYIDGTEYGGIIDRRKTDAGISTKTYEGRTWQGILVNKVISPLSGQDYFRVTGTLDEAIAAVISRIGLSDYYTSSGSAEISVTNYKFDRYCDAYYGLRKLARSVGCKLMMRYENGAVRLWMETARVIVGDVDSDLMDFTITTNYRQVNHLVCLGMGELRNRDVIDLYVDAEGNISQTQTFFGTDEIAEVYDYNNVERAELLSSGTERLSEAQTQGAVEFSDVDGSIEGYVGDYIEARDNLNGQVVTAEIIKKVVQVSDGVLSISFEVDALDKLSSGSGSGGGESSGGGGGTVRYTADEGLPNYIDGHPNPAKNIVVDGYTIGAVLLTAAQTAALLD